MPRDLEVDRPKCAFLSRRIRLASRRVFGRPASSWNIWRNRAGAEDREEIANLLVPIV